ncbi:outer membrane biogenesis protein BamB [Rubripirellula tenax]|uniref:Outer membrane biogenesis protein BamB n=1 Tax=Rubripirellula tenax TaxID=2528015 RepID=A0A5C6FGV9_9BACT|nr:PQQ-binding-like beta-propeller repeat protein [Rubripirellula tenax]TWU60741.1 outer membrane biogenesis protein BamB [Rubripirellula tenax]
MRSLVSVTLLMVAFSVSASADNWAHWRGPDGNGVALDATPPVKWSATENVKWKVAVPGAGSGSPVVWEDRVFVTSGVPTGKSSGRLPELDFVTFCFHRADGKLLWKQTATTATPHQATHETNGFASASPCTDGEHVYSHFGSRGLYAYTMDGELVWKRDDFGNMTTRNDFGEGSSPTIAGDKILVPWDHEGPSFLYALSKATGETIWRTPRDEPTCWATPMVIPSASGPQVIMNGQTMARAYDLETGKELWACGGQTQRPVASPVFHDGVVYVGSGFRGSFLAAFKPDGRGDVEGTDAIVWSVDRDTPDIASPLLSGDRLYFFKAKTGLLTCLNAKSGESHFQTVRLPDISTTYASPVAAGGHVYLTGRSGATVVIDDAAKFNVVRVNSVGEGVDATPAIAGNQIFIRGAKHLHCIGE